MNTANGAPVDSNVSDGMLIILIARAKRSYRMHYLPGSNLLHACVWILQIITVRALRPNTIYKIRKIYTELLCCSRLLREYCFY